MNFKSLASRIEKKSYRLGLLSAASLTLPDFLCIGAQKAGTTWLFENLRKHPEIYLPPQKEVHYFDRDFLQPVRGYAKNFEAGRDKIKGDITPAYSVISGEKVSFIRRIMPEAKILFILRNPVERAWSHAVMNLAVQTKRSFSKISTSEFLAHFDLQRSIGRGSYLKTLSKWGSEFPRERIFVGFFEDVGSRPRELLTRIFGFLGVPVPEDWEGFPLQSVVRPFEAADGRSAGDYPMPPECRKYLEDLYRADIEKLYERFGAPVSDWRC